MGAYVMTFGIAKPIFDSGNQTFMAASLALLAAVSFALSTIFSKRALRNVDYGLGTYIRFLIFSAVMILIVIPSGDIARISDISQEQIFILILIVLTTGSLATYLYYYGLKYISASVSSICELAFPLTAVLLEFILHGKILSMVQWAGVALLFVAIRQVTAITKSEAESQND
jgi:drug/metabolite transporter (DMT)-like permease